MIWKWVCLLHLFLFLHQNFRLINDFFNKNVMWNQRMKHHLHTNKVQRKDQKDGAKSILIGEYVTPENFNLRSILRTKELVLFMMGHGEDNTNQLWLQLKIEGMMLW